LYASFIRERLGMWFNSRSQKIWIFFFAKIWYGLYFLDRFDVLILKIIFKKWKNIIDMYFNMKSYLKSTRNYTAKQVLSHVLTGSCYVTPHREVRNEHYACQLLCCAWHIFYGGWLYGPGPHFPSPWRSPSISYQTET